MKQPLDLRIVLGLCGILVLVAAAVSAPIVAPHDPYEITLVDAPQAPSAVHLFGTDQLGRDLFSRTLFALRHSLAITAAASLAILSAGTIMGIAGGYFGGVLDAGIVALIDCTLAFPTLLLTIAICATLGPGVSTIFLSLAAAGWASAARIIRARTQEIAAREFVRVSRMMGARHGYVLRRHILPHCAPTLFILFIMTLAVAILAESSLSFLGFGLSPPHPTLGKLVYDGARFFRSAPWWSFFPGLVVALAITSLNLLGDGLRRRLYDA